MGDKTDAIGAHLIDNASIGENGLAANHDTVDHRHTDSHSRIVDHLALNAQRLTFLLHNFWSARWHTLSRDHFNAKASFAHALYHVKDNTWVAMDKHGLKEKRENE